MDCLVDYILQFGTCFAQGFQNKVLRIYINSNIGDLVLVDYCLTLYVVGTLVPAIGYHSL
jgi:hypothetical protein